MGARRRSAKGAQWQKVRCAHVDEELGACRDGLWEVHDDGELREEGVGRGCAESPPEHIENLQLSLLDGLPRMLHGTKEPQLADGRHLGLHELGANKHTGEDCSLDGDGGPRLWPEFLNLARVSVEIADRKTSSLYL